MKPAWGHARQVPDTVKVRCADLRLPVDTVSCNTAASVQCDAPLLRVHPSRSKDCARVMVCVACNKQE